MLWQKIKTGFGKVIELGKYLFSRIFSEATGETSNRKFRFFFLSSSIAILFFIIFILIGKNPFSLLVPFTFYDLPSLDKRTLVTLYISDGKNNVLKSKRKLLLSESDIRKNLHIILGELSQPPYEDSIESTEENVFPKKLPDMRSSIISTWFLDSGKKLILDFNEVGIQKELSTIRVKLDINEEDSSENKSKEEEIIENKRQEELQKARIRILNTALAALEKTIFINFPSIETLEFRLNGMSKQFNGLEYNLVETKKRN
ncbi:MAG: hypothetical protein KBA66_21350 [Leptospiraceae bacterium]|nr:hypothetical protein [Leptospiraceae bacterium]